MKCIVRKRAGLLVAGLTAACAAGTASAAKPLVIARDGQTDAVVIVSPKASIGEKGLAKSDNPRRFERFAAEDLVQYIGLMTGASPTLADTPEAIEKARSEKSKPVILIGAEALKADKKLSKTLERTASPDPMIRANAIAVRRDDNRVYLAGLTDAGHYHAAAWLLQHWGCRWYLPTEFGECVPSQPTLTLDDVDHAHAAPFEYRQYWVSWNGSGKDGVPFKLRNFMTVDMPRIYTAHALGKLIKDFIPEGKSRLDVSYTDPAMAEHIAAKVISHCDEYGRDWATIGMSDGVYKTNAARDRELQAGLDDKYYLVPSMSDVFMTLYNRIARIIKERRPNLYEDLRLGFLIYSNLSIPPQRVLEAESCLYGDIAPIDIDPIHGMDDVWSPPHREYREMMARWADIMDGRVRIYDYDQAMLVWRDLPAPTHQAFAQDVKHYAEAGVLGFVTESRMAIATTFLNLHLRGQLMWNPDLDVESHLADFYPRFYGPAAEPMSRYWGAIFRAWDETIVTEHENMVIPAIYTPELIAELRTHMQAAEDAAADLRDKDDALTRNEALYAERLRFTRLSFDLIDQYVAAVLAAARDADYETAHELGLKALATRRELATMNPTFTTNVVSGGGMQEKEYGGSPAWMPGEVKMYGDLNKLCDGTNGKLVKKLPLEWAFRRDPHDTGLARGWGYRSEIDLSYWRKYGDEVSIHSRKDYPTTEWEMLRTDLYMQAQGVLHPDRQSFTGYAWYRTPVKLSRSHAKNSLRIRFPGLFSEAWLYVNGKLVAHRQQNPMWWRNSYAFTRDVDLGDHVQPGKNLIVLRNRIQHHVGGMFRRPFLYEPVATDSEQDKK